MQTDPSTNNPGAPPRAPRSLRTAAAAGLVACWILIAGLIASPQPVPADPPAAKPNVVLLTTDDQTLEEMQALPRTTSWIAGQGATFDRAYISYPLCCPARATILSGQYMHNNGVRGNGGAFGGWQAFRGGGTEARALPTWLKDAGYYNVQIGKYMNGWNGGVPEVPPGWDEWYGKYSEFNSAFLGSRLYYNYRMLEDPPPGVPNPTCRHPSPAPDGEPFTCHYNVSGAEYQTDVIRDKAVEAIRRIGGDDDPRRPFFLKVDFNAPHSPYLPAVRHQGLFAGVKLEKPGGFNEKNISDKPRFLRRLPRLGKNKRSALNENRRRRLEMLLAVDEAIDAMMRTLAQENELQNTYVIFLSDNGYFHGEYRIRSGKYLPHEPSSHVPLLIRGPGIPADVHSEELVSNVDIAETIREVARAPAKLPQDGRTLLPFAALPDLESTRPLLLEGDTGPGIDDETGEGPDLSSDRRKLKKYRKKLKRQKRQLRAHCNRLKRRAPQRALLCYRRGVENLEQEPTDSDYNLIAPAYRALRTDRYLLTLYSTGAVELYDMRRDPHQLRSVHKERRYKPIRKWMLKHLHEVSTCAGASCSEQIGREPPRKKKNKKGKKSRKRAR